MPRSARRFLAGQPHHFVVRGNNRGDVFYRDVDRIHFLECLERACADYQLAIHAYVLMSNHVHLLATGPDAASAAGFFRSMGARYVKYFNDVNKRTGSLWQGRFWSNPVQSDDYLLNCMRYIEMNPVRAGIVDAPGNYFWSSHLCHALGMDNPLVKPHPTFIALSGTPELRRRAYRRYFDPSDDQKALDERFRRSVRRGWAVGDEEYVRWANSMLEAT